MDWLILLSMIFLFIKDSRFLKTQTAFMRRVSGVLIKYITRIYTKRKVSVLECYGCLLSTLNNLYNLQSSYLDKLDNDEFFQFCVKHYESLTTELDYWLTRDHAIRLNQINLWLETVRPIENSIYFCLDILRRSSETKEVCANNGFYLIKLNQEKKIRLLRITMQSDNYFFPRISLVPQRATISFMLLNEDNKYIQIKDNISFVLDLCYI